ncbi:hypothetical protein ACFVYJ_13305 [Pontibacter sp. JAM-7]|uniref:hypothetical protein n=1 Tax=Pontibacter sp. JAM-7 TaxID=3366581 RepID=UPI003AF4F13D
MLATLRILKFLVIVLLLLALAAAAGYLYMWWQITRTADAVQDAIAPFVTMEYASVEIEPLKSEAGIRNVRLTPVGMQDAITVERMLLRTDNPLQLLQAPQGLSKEQLPDAFSVIVTGINLNLQSDFMRMLAENAVAVQEEAGPSYDTLGCGDLQYMGLPQWRKMGFSQLLSDVQLSYRLDRLVQTARFDLFAETLGVARVEASLAIGSSEKTPTVSGLFSPNTLLESIELRMQDLGYNLRRNRFCAQLNDEEVAEYRARYRDLLAVRLANEGWQIPVSLLDAYDTLNNPGGSMLARVRPQMMMGPQAASLMQQPEDLLAVLKPYVEFSGKQVSLQGVRWDPSQKQQPALATPKQSPAETEATDQVDAKAAESLPAKVTADRPAGIGRPLIVLPERKTLQRVAVNQLSGHVGHHAVLRTYFGRRVEGRIISVSRAEVVIEHRPPDGRGTATYPIARDKIELAEVLF